MYCIYIGLGIYSVCFPKLEIIFYSFCLFFGPITDIKIGNCLLRNCIDIFPASDKSRVNGNIFGFKSLEAFKLENELENRRIEQERKYRDLVRKVLEIDNKLNTKFKLLGEIILKLSKERKVNNSHQNFSP